MERTEFTPIYRILKEQPYFYKWRKEAIKILEHYRKIELYKATTVPSFFVDTTILMSDLPYIKDIQKIHLLWLASALKHRNNSRTDEIRLKSSLKYEINWSRKHLSYDTDEWEEILKECPILT